MTPHEKLSDLIERRGDLPGSNIVLSVEQARLLVAEHNALIEAKTPEGFEINTRNKNIDAHFQLQRLKRMEAEDAAISGGLSL